MLLVALLVAAVDPSAASVAVARSEGAGSESTPPLRLGARAAVVVDDATGLVLYDYRGEQPLPIASLTKMMTALVALEHASVDWPITATQNSLAEPSVIGLAPGDTLRLEDMLYGLVMESGNDAALAIAETLGGGSVERFVGWMNDKARAMGLKHTHFANPHGLDADGQYSSALDVAEIARLYLRQPLLARIAATQEYRVTGTPEWTFRNINRFLRDYDGADGIKTGYEVQAGRCIAASATRDGHRLIAVVLHDDEYLDDARALLDFGFEVRRWLDDYDVGAVATRPEPTANQALVLQPTWVPVGIPRTARGELRPLVRAELALEGGGSVYRALRALSYHPVGVSAPVD